MLKKIVGIHHAVRDDIDNLITYRALPTEGIKMEKLNPFIFLNHHGPQEFERNNRGLPFGPHPHRGIETVTFIIDGELTHSDSSGSKSTITSGGIQWMTAGKGLVHTEVSSEEFKKKGGNIEILQLWINLPKKHKMSNPFYKGLQVNDIPSAPDDGGKVRIKIISGFYGDVSGAIKPLTDISLYLMYFSEGGTNRRNIPEGHVVFFYIIRGKVSVNGAVAEAYNLVEFSEQGEDIEAFADNESIIIFGHTEKLNEPIAAQGPFVMNTYEEIMEAYSDFQTGKFK